MKPRTKRINVPKPPRLDKTHRFIVKMRQIQKEVELKKGKK